MHAVFLRKKFIGESEDLQEGSKVKGGLGSSHTAPCGAAVPARPPTHRESTLETILCFNNGPEAPQFAVPRS